MRRWRNDKGAASVLAVFLLLILAFLGLMAFGSAVAGNKLAAKSEDWLSDYYQLIARTEEGIAAADAALREAEMMARRYMEQRLFESNITGLPQEIQDSIRRFYALARVDAQAFYSHVMEKVYYYYVINNIELLAESNPDIMLTFGSDLLLDPDYFAKDYDGEENPITIGIFAGEGDKPGSRNLTAVLAVNKMRYTWDYSEENAFGGRENGFVSRFRVIQYMQWQGYAASGSEGGEFDGRIIK